MMYTEFVKKFLRNPFQSPLSALIDEISPSKSENENADKALAFIRDQISEMITQGALPPLTSEKIMVVGSHYRGTDLSPLEDFDIFILLDPSLVDIHEKEKLINLVTKDNFLSSCLDESLHLLPNKLILTLQNAFSQRFPSKICSMGQAVRIRLEKFSLDIKISPAFSQNDTFFIPAERSELHWRNVSPTKEKLILNKLNEQHNNFVTPLIRYMKIWNEVKNNESLTNYHIEAIAYLIFAEIPTSTKNLSDALFLYVKQMSKYIYNCPDPTNLDAPINRYLHDNIDQWYLFMNRISELKNAVASGEKGIVQLITTEVE